MINLIEPLLPRYEGKPDEKAKSINDLSYKRLKGLSQVIDNKRGSKFNERIDAILNKKLLGPSKIISYTFYLPL